jgi:hypothetical protein
MELLFKYTSFVSGGLKMKCRSLDCAHKVGVIKKKLHQTHDSPWGVCLPPINKNTWQPLGSLFATYQQTHGSPWGVCSPPINKE